MKTVGRCALAASRDSKARFKFQLISITDLSPDMEIIGWSGGAGRHVGIEISADVTEK